MKIYILHIKTPVLNRSITENRYFCSTNENCWCHCVSAITCPPLPDHSYGSITYSPDDTPPYLFGTQAMYVTVCLEGLERRGGDDVRNCSSGGNQSHIGIWTGTVPMCLSKLSHIASYTS